MTVFIQPLRGTFIEPLYFNWAVRDCWFNARGRGRGHSFHFPASLDIQLPLFWPIFSESGIIFSVHDPVRPGIIGQSFWPPKIEKLKSLEYRHVVYQMKAKNSSNTMKICPDKWEVKWLTSGWPTLTSDDLKTFHDVYQKKAEHQRISYITFFL